MKVEMNLDELAYRRVQMGLKNIAEKVPSHASRAMRRAAMRIVNRAKLYVPEDTEALKDSIRLEAARGARGRLEINVIVGGMEVINVRGRQVNLDQYAAIIHEAYDSMEPGKKTLEKMELYPGKVGAGFLTRAAEDERETLSRNMIEEITRLIQSEGFK